MESMFAPLTIDDKKLVNCCFVFPPIKLGVGILTEREQTANCSFIGTLQKMRPP